MLYIYGFAFWDYQPRDSFTEHIFCFPPYGDFGPPLMARLSLPGLTIGLPISLFSSLVIPCTPVTFDPNTSSQEHQSHVDPSPSSPDVSSPILPLRLLKLVVLLFRWIIRIRKGRLRRGKTNKKPSVNQSLLPVRRVLIYTPQDRVSPNSLVGFARVITF